MSVMEFILVAHAIIVGLAVAEILRGFADLVRAESVQLSYRLLLIASWTLLLLLQVWWAIWRVGDRAVWTFPEFFAFLLPAGTLYVIARLCFPVTLSGADLRDYYERVARVIWWLVAATYLCFALLMAPFIFGRVVPSIFASQVAIAVLALVASGVKNARFQLAVIVAMIAQVLWRGLSDVIGG